ncbi:hypothetical protein BGZ98_001899, partial [Dissophora globulifera]
MKSKARNAKGAKKSSNSVAHDSKEAKQDGPANNLQPSPQKQNPSGSHYQQQNSNPAKTTADDQDADSRSMRSPEGSASLHHSTQNSNKDLSNTTNGTDAHSGYRRILAKVAVTTSMETEFIGALDSDLAEHADQEGQPNSSSESDDVDYEDMDIYDEQVDGADSEDFDALGAYEHDDFLSSQEAILMELRREQVEFEENVRQLQQQLQRQASLFPLSVEEKADMDKQGCTLCSEPKSCLCLERYGWVWRPAIVEALATAAAAIANFSVRQSRGTLHMNDGESFLQRAFQYSEFLPRSKRLVARPRAHHQQGSAQPTLSSHAGGEGAPFFYSNSTNATVNIDDAGGQTAPIRHMYRGTTPPLPAVVYPLPPDAPYRFRRKSSEFLEPVGEFHEFQSAEGNSRQVLLHVWPPSSLDAPLLQKLEACCRDFQENDVVRGHSGDGFLNGWRPPWKQAHQTGVLRFGHWRVRAPAGQGSRLYPPFQTPLTLAAGRGSVLGSNLSVGGQP